MGPDTTKATRRVGGGTRVDIVILSALLFVCAAVLAGFSWTRPATASSIVSYQQSGALSYSAPTPSTSVYGTAGVKTRQPVYVGDAPAIKITYKYQFATDARASLSGKAQLVARLGDGRGLNRVVPLQSPIRFHGRTLKDTATLSFPALQAIANAFDRVLGNTAGVYAVEIEPTISVRGLIASQPIDSTFDPAVKFTFNSTILTLTSLPNSSTSVFAKTGTAGVGRPVISTAESSVQVPAADAARLFAGFTVTQVRIGSLILLAIALFFGGFFGMPLLQEARSDDERVRLSSRIGSSVVRVTSLPDSPQGVVELASFDGLAQVAKRLECPLLHLPCDAEDVYAVVDNGTVYRYRIASTQLGKVLPAKPDAPRHAAQEREDTVPHAQTS